MIRGEVHWLWRAVDQHGVVLDEILQRRRDKRAAKRLLIKLLKRQGQAPRRIVTDKLASYRAAKREAAPGMEHRSVLMLLISRPDSQPGLGGHPHMTRLTLNRLGRGPTEAIVAHLAGGRGLPEEVLGEIAARPTGYRCSWRN